MATMAEPRLYTYTVYHGMAWYGMATLGVVLLTLCSLLAGLTLALGGLDMTWLQLRSVTGTPKQRYELT
jgi:metal transporter CNNM